MCSLRFLDSKFFAKNSICENKKYPAHTYSLQMQKNICMSHENKLSMKSKSVSHILYRINIHFRKDTIMPGVNLILQLNQLN